MHFLPKRLMRIKHGHMFRIMRYRIARIMKDASFPPIVPRIAPRDRRASTILAGATAQGMDLTHEYGIQSMYFYAKHFQ
jgi:hypothetical protein